jgi:hypothetical protein
MSRLETLALERFPQRALVMAAAAFAAFLVDFVSKELAVALEPDTLLFHVSDRDPFGLGAALILVVGAMSLLACVVPSRIVAIGAGAALGGALGNRMSREWWSSHGGSPDFIRFGDGSTGNVADLFIAAGLGVMLIGSVVWLVRAVASHSRA